MKVILLKNVQKVGRADQVVEVPDGYAANALFPKKLAIAATQSNLDALKRKQSDAAAKTAKHNDVLAAAVTQIGTLVYKVKVNDKGSLFSRVTALDITKALAQKGISFDHHILHLPDEGIKQIGVYEIKVLDGSYTGSFTLSVEAQ